MTEKKYKNTFCGAKNKELTIPQIIAGLYQGLIRFDKLPEEAQKEVEARVKPNPPGFLNTAEDDARGLIRTAAGTRKATPEELATFPQNNPEDQPHTLPHGRQTPHKAKPEKDQCDSQDAV